MDTISRDNNTGGLLPWAGAILGGIGLLLGGIALAKVSSLGTKVADDNSALTTKVEEVSASASKALRTATDAKAGSDNLQQVVPWIQQAGPVITALQEDVKALKAKGVSTPANGNKGPVVAGKDEYVVKAGDTGGKIAAATGFKVSELEAVNPGINWNRLQPNQKIKLPAKK
jgi:LysM repeat protein